jgi:ribose 5-phosphate isomerase B
MIALGSDHAGYPLKEEIIKYLNNKGIEYKDFGSCDTKSVDYPIYGLAVAEAVRDGMYEKGIIVCGTGIGISIVANKVPGIRAAVCSDCYMAKMSREHNDTNILALGQRVLGVGLALDILDTWLNTAFEGGRHIARIEMINNIERKYSK